MKKNRKRGWAVTGAAVLMALMIGAIGALTYAGGAETAGSESGEEAFEVFDTVEAEIQTLEGRQPGQY